MAFDFVGYIDTALASQHSALLPNQISDTRSVYFKHLIAFTMHDYIQRFEYEPDTTYQLLHHQKPDLVLSTAQAVLNVIRQHEAASTFFAPIQTDLIPVASTVSQRIADELLALDQQSHLGITGIHELLSQQYQYIQPMVLPWFWQAIDTVAPHETLSQVVDAQQVMHEFNQILQQTGQHNPPSTVQSTSDPQFNNRYIKKELTAKSASKSSHKKEIYLLLTIILVALSLFLLYQSLS